MIKQIQLRGISRTPSDKMSEDGGLSESLNMYLDTAENAPAFVPEDVTEKLGLPADLEAERIFIHKTANYENYIVVQEGRIVAYTPGIEDEEPLLVMELPEGEKVNDITSVGNTLVISTGVNTFYSLFAEATYKLLGSEIPVPNIEFRSISNYYDLDTNSSLLIGDGGPTTLGGINAFLVDSWNNAIKDIENNITNTNTSILTKIKEDLWAAINEKVNTYKAKDLFCAPFFVRFAVRLYDGSYINHSVPILLGAGFDNFVEVSGRKSQSSSNIRSEIIYRLNNLFQVNTYLLSWDTEGWEDVVKSVDIFASTSIYFPYYNSFFANLRQTSSSTAGDSTVTEYEITFDANGLTPFDAIEQELLSKSVFSKIGSFKIGDTQLEKGWDLAEAKNIKREEDLLLADKLPDQTFAEHPSHNKLYNYNNRLLATAATSSLPRGYPFLNAVNIALRRTGGESIDKYAWPLVLKFHARGSASSRTVLGEYYDKTPYFYTYEIDTSDEGGASISNGVPFGFVAYPDPLCNKLEIQTSADEIYEITMKPHPFLNCSYGYVGLSKPIVNSDNLTGQGRLEEFLYENPRKEMSHSLLVYKSDNPFVVGQTFTFQSKIIDVAIATTALSQGQFGQFPLYVFTEDGIWAMETAADGSFISQKPLSREVCINPDSICSIDNAVVFVTAKAVMMIQGSQVMNISPYMNGRHYTPNESAMNIIGKQEGFDTFTDAISDDDPFMSFMKDAKVAYDYTGQRLVFISPSNTGFQYVYKIDTQTWHKVAFEGLDLDTPLNSYPECLVQGEGPAILQVCKVDVNSAEDSDNYLVNYIKENHFPLLSDEVILDFLHNGGGINVTHLSEEQKDEFFSDMSELSISVYYEEKETLTSRIYSLSTVLDAKPDLENPQKVAKGILITRPFDLGMPDVYKSITNIKIRGDFDKGNVKYILQGSNDGRTFYTLNTLRGKSWRMFRLFILADLEPTERISWIDVDFEPRYNTKLR